MFFREWAKLEHRILVPGGRIMIAANPLVSDLVYVPMLEAASEKRGELIRLVQALRGGDRPNYAREEFDLATVMRRSGCEPTTNAAGIIDISLWPRFWHPWSSGLIFLSTSSSYEGRQSLGCKTLKRGLRSLPKKNSHSAPMFIA